MKQMTGFNFSPVFMDLEVDGTAAGTVFIELFNETVKNKQKGPPVVVRRSNTNFFFFLSKVPITAENFRLLTTG